MKKIAIGFVAALGLFGIAGCTATPAGNDRAIVEDEIYPVYQIRTDDGRVLDCVFIGYGYGQSSVGGPSCDWSNAR